MWCWWLVMWWSLIDCDQEMVQYQDQIWSNWSWESFNFPSDMEIKWCVLQGSGGVANANVVARREINAKIRLNKIILRFNIISRFSCCEFQFRDLTISSFSELKESLKKFIDMTAELQEGHSPSEGSPYGFLIQVWKCYGMLLILHLLFLQALWGNFLKNGVTEYISIQV